MAKTTLHGRYDTGIGDASNWGIDDIRRVTGWNVVRGTVNVALECPETHALRDPVDFRLAENERTDGRDEDLNFEKCVIVLPGGARVRGLIARTSRNFWGPGRLEIMAEQILRDRYGLEEGTPIDVEVWSGPGAAKEAEDATVVLAQ